jgi:hypothetical protein
MYKGITDLGTGGHSKRPKTKKISNNSPHYSLDIKGANSFNKLRGISIPDNSYRVIFGVNDLKI